MPLHRPGLSTVFTAHELAAKRQKPVVRIAGARPVSLPGTEIIPQVAPQPIVDNNPALTPGA